MPPDLLLSSPAKRDHLIRRSDLDRAQDDPIFFLQLMADPNN
jgi:hypothetical protein